MAEKDAFGRDIDEDPLADMGWDAEGTSASTTSTETENAAARGSAGAGRSGPDPAAAVRRAAATVGGSARKLDVPTSLPGMSTFDPPGRQSRRRARRAGLIGCLIPVVFLFVLSIFVLAFIGSQVEDTADRVRDGVATVATIAAPAPAPAPTTTEEPGGGSATTVRDDGPAPRGLNRTSLFLRGNLAPALRRLRAQAGGRVRLMRIEAARVDVHVVKGSRSRWYQFADGKVTSAQSSPATSTLREQAFAWSAIDPSAPKRIVQSAAGRARRPASSFDYLVLFDVAGVRWSAFMKGGKGFSASTNGRSVSPIGG